MTHAHVIQFFKDLGECPLTRIVSTNGNVPDGLGPMWFDDATHPIFALEWDGDSPVPWPDHELTQALDLKAHRWTIRLFERVHDHGNDWDEWRQTWRVDAETRNDAIRLAWERLRDVNRTGAVDMDQWLRSIGRSDLLAVPARVD